jgi:hypothetical protein
VLFVVMATLLALVEAITTGMTNLAPMFVAWAATLRRVDFRPNAVFLLFGLTGTLAEAGFGSRSPRWWHYRWPFSCPSFSRFPWLP